MRKFLFNLSAILTAFFFAAAPAVLWNCRGAGLLAAGLKMRAAQCCDTHQCCAQGAHKNCMGVKKAPSAIVTLAGTEKPWMGAPSLVFALGKIPPGLIPLLLPGTPTESPSPPGFSPVLRI
jgi:hypothetical protein